MARATANHTTKLSTMFRDPFLKAAFKAAENEGTVEIYTGRDRDGALVSAFQPRVLNGGAAVRPELELA